MVKGREEWAVLHDGRLLCLSDTGKITFTRQAAEAIRDVMGGQLCKLTMTSESGETLLLSR